MDDLKLLEHFFDIDSIDLRGKQKLGGANIESKNKYLDANGGVGMTRKAVEAMVESCFCTNPSNTIAEAGIIAYDKYSNAIDRIKSSLLNCNSTGERSKMRATEDIEESEWKLVLTSGATEGLVSIIRSMKDPVFHTLLLKGYHPVIPLIMKEYDMSYVVCDATPQDVEDAMSKYTFSGLMATHTISMTGDVIDIKSIGEVFHRGMPGSTFVVDGTQSVGKIPLDIEDSGADMFVFSSHKFGGPKGCGGVLLSDDTKWKPLLPGTQQDGMRGGTLNVMGAVGTAVAMEEAMSDIKEKSKRTKASMLDLASAIEKLDLPRVKVLSSLNKGGNTVLIGVPFCSKVLAREIVSRGYDVGIGTACQTGGEIMDPENEFDPAYRREFHLRVSLPVGETLGVSEFIAVFKESWDTVLLRTKEKIEGMMWG